jgi:tetratricopeptide (TPR) repeat protein
MEVELLGFEREEDCPSSEVPERYFRFQRSGDPTPILPVLRHNAWDVLSLVALAAHLAAICAGETNPLQAGRAAEYAGDLENALGHFDRALAGSMPRAQRLETLERAARAAARLHDWERSAAYWQTLLAEPRARRVAPYVELAKLYEHRLGELPAALRLTDEALALHGRGLLTAGAPNSEYSAEALRHRQLRLARRLGLRAEGR